MLTCGKLFLLRVADSGVTDAVCAVIVSEYVKRFPIIYVLWLAIIIFTK